MAPSMVILTPLEHFHKLLETPIKSVVGLLPYIAVVAYPAPVTQMGPLMIKVPQLSWV